MENSAARPRAELALAAGAPSGGGGRGPDLPQPGLIAGGLLAIAGAALKHPGRGGGGEYCQGIRVLARVPTGVKQ